MTKEGTWWQSTEMRLHPVREPCMHAFASSSLTMHMIIISAICNRSMSSSSRDPQYRSAAANEINNQYLYCVVMYSENSIFVVLHSENSKRLAELWSLKWLLGTVLLQRQC